jgi:hypothetical protein
LGSVSIDVTHDDGGAFNCEETSSGFANTATCTSHQSYFAFSESET